MIRGLYSSAGALQVAERNHEVIAHNLANANMPGFRRQVVAFESFFSEGGGSPSHTSHSAPIGAPGSRPTTVFDPGDMYYTEKPLDVAVKGDAFFVVEGPNGPLYTRNGTFQIDPNGVLQTGGGLAVTGTAGRITVPPGTSKIVIAEDGTVRADGSDIGQLKLSAFKDTSQLVPAGTTLYQAPAGVNPIRSDKSTVQQGYREMSNVQVVDEMVRMIAGMRMYEASQRSLKAISDAVEQRTNGQPQ